jgi:hypothetical protein
VAQPLNAHGECLLSPVCSVNLAQHPDNEKPLGVQPLSIDSLRAQGTLRGWSKLVEAAVAVAAWQVLLASDAEAVAR